MSVGPHGAKAFSLEASPDRGQALSTLLVFCGGRWPGVRALGLLVLASLGTLLNSSSYCL